MRECSAYDTVIAAACSSDCKKMQKTGRGDVKVMFELAEE